MIGEGVGAAMVKMVGVMVARIDLVNGQKMMVDKDERGETEDGDGNGSGGEEPNVFN